MEEKKQEEEEEEASGDGGSIKESTLRYNKVHPRKPSALFAPTLPPRLSPGSSSITPSNLLCSSTLLIFPSVLGERPFLLPRRLRWLYREWLYLAVGDSKRDEEEEEEEVAGLGARRGEEEKSERVEEVLPCDGKFKNLSTRCRTTRGNFIISAVCAKERESGGEKRRGCRRRRRRGGGDGGDEDDEGDEGDEGGSTNYTANGDIAFINSFAVATRGSERRNFVRRPGAPARTIRTGIARSADKAPVIDAPRELKTLRCRIIREGLFDTLPEVLAFFTLI